MSIRNIKSSSRGKSRFHYPAKYGYGSQIPDLSERKSYSECPNCKSELVKKNGKYGVFYSCSKFPDCVFACNKSDVVLKNF